jgi:hypothetical protein
MISRLTAAAAVLSIALLAPAAAVATPADTTAPAPPSVDSTLPAGNVENAGAVDFTFSSEPGATFQCAIDSDPLSDCDDVTTFGNLSEADHTLTVVAVDAAANISDPTTVDWTEDYTAPDAPATPTPRRATRAKRAAALPAASTATRSCRARAR